MKRWFVTLRIVVLVAILVVHLSACGEEPIRHRSALRTGRDIGNGISFALDMNTDCVEPGQPLVLTLTLYSLFDSSYAFPDTPPLDIVLLDAAQPPNPVAQWSTSEDYPATVLPLQPGETRAYTWTWTSVDPVGPLWVDVHIAVQAADGTQWRFADHIQKVGVGEGYGVLGADDVLAKCADMQPAR